MRKSRHDCSDEIQIRRNETMNRAFWTEKLSRNKAHDRKVTRTLRADVWCVLRVWECALTRRRSPATVRRIARAVPRWTTHLRSSALMFSTKCLVRWKPKALECGEHHRFWWRRCGCDVAQSGDSRRSPKPSAITAHGCRGRGGAGSMSGDERR